MADREVWGFTITTKPAGRNAWPHPSAAERAVGSEKRVHPRRHRPEPTKNSQALPDDHPCNARRLRKPIARSPRVKGLHRKDAHPGLWSIIVIELFNSISPFATVAAAQTRS